MGQVWLYFSYALPILLLVYQNYSHQNIMVNKAVRGTSEILTCGYWRVQHTTYLCTLNKMKYYLLCTCAINNYAEINYIFYMFTIDNEIANVSSPI